MRIKQTRIIQRSAVIIASVAIASACTSGTKDSPAQADHLIAESATGDAASWSSLQKPVAIRADRGGHILVADEADSKIVIFDSLGMRLQDFGRQGQGPGEFLKIRDIAPYTNEIIVFDQTPGRFYRLSSDGRFLGSVQFEGAGDELFSALGDSLLVFASSVRWSLPPANATKNAIPEWPLARVISPTGKPLFDIGQRVKVASPFAAHIRNFVLPAGTTDGKYVWLAFMNSPEVQLYDAQSGTLQSIQRELPFKWQEIPGDYMPQLAKAGTGGPPPAPFDVISLGIATDSTGRAFILTALESPKPTQEGTKEMAVDIISPTNLSLKRTIVAGQFTHIAVSPNGARVYLLDTQSGALQSFRVPQ